MKPCKLCGGEMSGKSGEQPVVHDDSKVCIDNLQKRAATAEKGIRAYKWLVEGFRLVGHSVRLSDITDEENNVLRCHLSCTCCAPSYGLTLAMPLSDVLDFLGRTEVKFLVINRSD